jgi:putative transposase
MKRDGNPKLVRRVRPKFLSGGDEGYRQYRLPGNRWLNNRPGYSHLPFRRKEQAMCKVRSLEALQKFALALSSIHHHSSHKRPQSRPGSIQQKPGQCHGGIAPTCRPNLR